MADDLFGASRGQDLDRAGPQQARSGGRDRPTAVRMLQQTLGNARLTRMRQRLQRQEGDAPDWIKKEIGVTAEAERDFERLQQVEEAAVAPPVTKGGEPLPPQLQAHAEKELGVSLDDVQVMSHASADTDPIDAKAFAEPNEGGGHAIYLSNDVDLGQEDGQFTMMHELSHVAQQKKGQASGLQGLGGDEGQRNDLEKSADETGRRMLQGIR